MKINLAALCLLILTLAAASPTTEPEEVDSVQATGAWNTSHAIKNATKTNPAANQATGIRRTVGAPANGATGLIRTARTGTGRPANARRNATKWITAASRATGTGIIAGVAASGAGTRIPIAKIGSGIRASARRFVSRIGGAGPVIGIGISVVVRGDGVITINRAVGIGIGIVVSVCVNDSGVSGLCLVALIQRQTSVRA
ncbi:hypothetical protein BDV28DRAFT_151307 [Aspergillus coremiiformis]|uniref:Uncharacterized protein n=1 Tax=Aspergillus coremiiformis TaxID=138285 RepID=A0A5N6YX97_9EURO|nr:hypothetical protein BDV28DRAFT_151307 [Aspergillus coremiiformis]